MLSSTSSVSDFLGAGPNSEKKTSSQLLSSSSLQIGISSSPAISSCTEQLFSVFLQQTPAQYLYWKHPSKNPDYTPESESVFSRFSV